MLSLFYINIFSRLITSCYDYHFRKDAVLEKLASLDDGSGYMKYNDVIKVPVEMCCFKKEWSKYLVEDFGCKEGSDVSKDKLEKVIKGFCG